MNLRTLFLIHGVIDQVILILTKALHVDTYGLIADDTDCCLLTMTEVEEYLRMVHDGGFAMFVVCKDRILGDTILLTKGLFQKPIGQHTESLSLFMSELQGLFPTLLRDFLQSRLEIKLPDILAYQYPHFFIFHFYIFTFSLQSYFGHGNLAVHILLGTQVYELTSLLRHTLTTRNQFIVRTIIGLLHLMDLLAQFIVTLYEVT